MSDDYSYDGAPIQAGLQRNATHLTGDKPHFSSIGLRIMVVIDVLYIDQPGNRSRTYTEYTCRDLQSGENVPYCRTLTTMGGIDDGEDVTLAPATKLREGARSIKFSSSTVARDTDGTMVLVGFIEGSRDRPVIIGAFPHIGSTLGATREDGQRRLIKHKGSSIEMREDGTFVITRTVDTTATTVTIAPSGDVFLNRLDGSRIALEAGVVTTEATQIKLGALAAEAVVMGNTADAVVAQPVAAAAANLSTAIANALVTLAPDLVLGTPTSATVGAISTLLTALLAYTATEQAAFAAFASTLSLKVKTE